MKEGTIKRRPNGCLMFLLLPTVTTTVLPFLLMPFGSIYFAFYAFKRGLFADGFFYLILGIVLGYGYYRVVKWKLNKNKISPIKRTKNTIEFQTEQGIIQMGNPFRGIFVIGAAGSGKSESIAIPLISQFVSKGFAGIVYDFKFPALASEVQTFIETNKSDLRHYFLNFNDPHRSHRCNPLHPRYLINTSYAREFSQAIISNLMKESIKKPDFWSRSATDLLTACIWYLKEERPDICDLPHACAMITANDTALLAKLQENPTTAQMTISIYNAMQRGAEGQTAGVIGTLQGAIAQINTPELMYIFSADDFSLDINNPQAPAVVTVGSYPTLTTTFAPLCSLVITVATKLMNQPEKHPSFVLLDEAPTVFIPNIEVLPNTGRSNQISTVIMCQDISQLTDGYGKEKADVLFAACNNHFYGRVASSQTSEILSKQFGKTDKTYVTQSTSRKTTQIIGSTSGQSESVQERDVMRSNEFLALQVGEFAGIAVESNQATFKTKFRRLNRPQATMKLPANQGDVYVYYRQVRNDINALLGSSANVESQGGKSAKLNDTQTNSRHDEKGNVFDVFGD